VIDNAETRRSGSCICSQAHTLAQILAEDQHRVDSDCGSFKSVSVLYTYYPLPSRIAVVQRLNGRLAQWAFAALMLTEWQSGGKTTVIEQAINHPFAVASFSFTILLASLAPKFASGVSLSELPKPATRSTLVSIPECFRIPWIP
jgi:hypothetical protein